VFFPTLGGATDGGWVAAAGFTAHAESMRWVRDVAWKLALGGMAAAGLGVVVLVVQAAREVMTDPSLSLIDGYWVGRLPWTAIGVDLVVAGSTVAVIAGLVGSWLNGGWIARVLATVVALVAAFWWAIALMPQPGGAPCTECGPQVADPITYAYSLPETAVLLLVVPAIVVTAIAALARPGTKATNQTRVAPPAST
jgi:hypothetical protein